MDLENKDTKKEKYKIDCFHISNLIYAYRRTNSDDLINEARTILIKHSKNSIYRYLAVLGPYGYTYETLFGIWKHYVVHFLNEIEFPIENIISYFKGFISHLFYRIIETEGRSRRESNYSTESIDSMIELEDNRQVRLDQIIPSNEDIPKRFSVQEIIEDYINNDENKVLDVSEKILLNLKIDGESFIDMSRETGFSYKQVVYLYNRALQKLKAVLIGIPKTLQNSIIF